MGKLRTAHHTTEKPKAESGSTILIQKFMFQNLQNTNAMVQWRPKIIQKTERI